MRRIRSSSRAHAFWMGVLLAVFVGAGCGPGRQPTLQPLVDVPHATRVPVIVIPGLTGTRLKDSASDKMVWGTARRIFFPRDRCHAGAIPVPPESASRDTVVAEEPLWRVKALGLFPVRAYAVLVDLLEANGYRLGDLRDPHPDETLFFLAYDWRRDMADTVRQLSKQLERLREVRGESTLHVNLVAQSSGGRMARWFLRYGDATVEELEAGAAPGDDRIAVDKMILVATANGGSLRVFEQLYHGRRYVPTVGRLFSPETFFTFSSLFDELPTFDHEFFIDENGNTLDIDLFDPANWQRYGWSIFRKRPAREADRRPEMFGSVEQRLARLATTLDLAWRRQAQLQRDDGARLETQYYQVQGSALPTPSRALLRRKKDGTWETVFAKKGRLPHAADLAPLAIEPGDGHVTAQSVETIAPHEREAMARDVLWVDGAHFKMLSTPEVQNALLEFLADP